MVTDDMEHKAGSCGGSREHNCYNWLEDLDQGTSNGLEFATPKASLFHQLDHSSYSSGAEFVSEPYPAGRGLQGCKSLYSLRSSWT